MVGKIDVEVDKDKERRNKGKAEEHTVYHSGDSPQWSLLS